MRLEHVYKDLLTMDHDEITDRIRRIRDGRVMPIATHQTKVKKKERKSNEDIRTYLKSLSPEARAEFIEGMGG